MQKSFWKSLPRPFFALAPMADVTDAAFRKIIAECGGPDVFWTEFVSADGLASKGKEKLLLSLRYSKKERPIVAQLFGANPETMEYAAGLVAELGFDGVDINMGCPDRAVEKQGAGAALIKKPELAKMLIRAAKRGAPNLPVSVKTRLGYNSNVFDSWIPNLLEEEPAAITIHGRTRKEMSKVPARWEDIQKVCELIEKISGKNRPLVIGNGDVLDLKDGFIKAQSSGVDGVMIGRGIFGNPWLFSGKNMIRKSAGKKDKKAVDIIKKSGIMIRHTYLFQELYAGHKPFDVMKKHYKAYINGFDGAKELRAKLMETKSAEEVRRIMETHYPKLKNIKY